MVFVKLVHDSNYQFFNNLPEINLFHSRMIRLPGRTPQLTVCNKRR